MAWALAGLATASTRLTPAICAASAATAAGSAASTTTSMASGFSACAALTVRAVAGLSLPSRCSATTRILDIGAFSGIRVPRGAGRPARPEGSEQALGLEGGDQLGRVLDLHAAAALRRGGIGGGLQAGAGVDAEVGQLQGLQRLALGLHDVRQLDEARLVEAQVGGHHCRKVDFQGLQAGIDLAGHRGLAVEI